MEVLIKEMESGHIPEVVKVHLKSFEGFFLSFLGPAFLRELYASLIKDPYRICLVAQKDTAVLGFAAGTIRASGVYSRLFRQRIFRFGLAAVPAIIKQPSIFPRLIRGITDPHGQADSALNRGALMSIAVLPREQRGGIGHELVRRFLEEASLAGSNQVDLTTNRYDNENTNRFYQKLGFRIESSFRTPEGLEMNRYVIDLE